MYFHVRKTPAYLAPTGANSWCWKLLDDNGNVIASGKGYANKDDCRAAVEKLKLVSPSTPVIDKPGD